MKYELNKTDIIEPGQCPAGIGDTLIHVFSPTLIKVHFFKTRTLFFTSQGTELRSTKLFVIAEQ